MQSTLPQPGQHAKCWPDSSDLSRNGASDDPGVVAQGIGGRVDVEGGQIGLRCRVPRRRGRSPSTSPRAASTTRTSASSARRPPSPDRGSGSPGRRRLLRCGRSSDRAQPAPVADSSFRAFLPGFEAATRSLLDGDVAAWKERLSAEPGSTLFTPFGGVIRGPRAVAEQYDRVAARFSPGPASLEVEYLSIATSGDLAVVVALERSMFRPVGSDSTLAGFTRATMVFRREAGNWKLWHRHMDHLGAPGE